VLPYWDAAGTGVMTLASVHVLRARDMLFIRNVLIVDAAVPGSSVRYSDRAKGGHMSFYRRMRSKEISDPNQPHPRLRDEPRPDTGPGYRPGEWKRQVQKEKEHAPKEDTCS
jgi:hypothetical protein